MVWRAQAPSTRDASPLRAPGTRLLLSLPAMLGAVCIVAARVYSIHHALLYYATLLVILVTIEICIAVMRYGPDEPVRVVGFILELMFVAGVTAAVVAIIGVIVMPFPIQ